MNSTAYPHPLRPEREGATPSVARIPAPIDTSRQIDGDQSEARTPILRFLKTNNVLVALGARFQLQLPGEIHAVPLAVNVDVSVLAQIRAIETLRGRSRRAHRGIALAGDDIAKPPHRLFVELRDLVLRIRRRIRDRSYAQLPLPEAHMHVRRAVLVVIFQD